MFSLWIHYGAVLNYSTMWPFLNETIASAWSFFRLHFIILNYCILKITQQVELNWVSLNMVDNLMSLILCLYRVKNIRVSYLITMTIL